jgi:hypothetical protein
MRATATLILVTLSYCAVAQSMIFGQEVDIVFRTSDKTQNFYLALAPKQAPKGLLVILPGFGGPPHNVLKETDLPAKARTHGYVVVIPYLATDTHCSDAVSQERLRTLIPELLIKYKVPADSFIIGGHSIGGNGALLYAENAFKVNDSKNVRPNLVFAVDPPLDMKHLYTSFAWFRKVNFSPAAVGEAEYFMNRFQKELGGTPSEKPAAYEAISSFYRDAPDGGNAQYLKSVPVRLYCDPDVNWYIENRRVPIEYTNLADLSACIVQLKLLGNDTAELVTNIGKGHFSDGRRHPHGFSQLDSDEFLKWADRMLARK